MSVTAAAAATPRIAVVKSSIYQDLWVSPPTKDPLEIFQSTLMRTPPIALAAHYGAEFLIVKDCNEFPCNFNKCTFNYSQFSDNMKYSRDNKYPELSFLDNTFHKHISLDEAAVSADSVDWGEKYDIVITINHCIPQRITEKYPRVMWCYYVGENDEKYLQQVLPGYHFILDQDFHTPAAPHKISFPYVYLATDTFEKIAARIFDAAAAAQPPRKGIYMEINNTSERPVVAIPAEFRAISEHTDQPIIVHHQNIIENLERMCSAKYYVKLLGRRIRGNSVLEAISAGLVVVGNRDKIVYKDLVAPECHAETPEQVGEIIRRLDSDADFYEYILYKQRFMMETIYFRGPYSALLEKYAAHAAAAAPAQLI